MNGALIPVAPPDKARRISGDMVFPPNPKVDVVGVIETPPFPRAFLLVDDSAPLRPRPTRGGPPDEDRRRLPRLDEPADERGEVDADIIRAKLVNEPDGGDGVELGVGRKVGGSTSGRGAGSAASI